MRKLFILVFVVLLSGCAVGNKYNYRSGLATLPIKSTDSTLLILSVEDLRPYILNGDKNPDFVGLQRGGFGNPFDVTTASGKPLADDISYMLGTSLEYSGYKVKILDGSPSKDNLSSLAKEFGSDRIVWMKIREWKSDIYMSIGLTYDFYLSIHDSDGNKLAENSLQGKEAAGGGKIGQEKNSQHLTDVLSKKIGYLFNKPEIKKALDL